MKTIIVSLLLVLILFISCKERNKFQNDFEGGSFSLVIKDCDEKMSLDNDFIIKRTNREIEIVYFGECLYEFYDYDMKGTMGIVGDTLDLKIEHQIKVKNKFKDKELWAVECMCVNNIKFNFENPISTELPIKLNGHFISEDSFD